MLGWGILWARTKVLVTFCLLQEPIYISAFNHVV
jgi:hypothetical protein